MKDKKKGKYLKKITEPITNTDGNKLICFKAELNAPEMSEY